MQTVDRSEFIKWTEGILLHFEKGQGFAVSEKDCEAAKEALEKGEKIALTVKGKIFSYLEVCEDQILEVLDES